MRNCPHNDSSNVFESSSTTEERITLFTGAKEDDMCLLTYEARNAAVALQLLQDKIGSTVT